MDDVRVIAPLLREPDRMEAEAATGLSAARALEFTFRLCDQPLAGLINGAPAAIWGVNPASIVLNKGAPWMLGTNALEKTGRYWLPVARFALNELGKEYKMLENYVDARNKKSIRWLKWLGFKIEDAAPYGPYGLLFHRFERGN